MNTTFPLISKSNWQTSKLKRSKSFGEAEYAWAFLRFDEQVVENYKKFILSLEEFLRNERRKREKKRKYKIQFSKAANKKCIVTSSPKSATALGRYVCEACPRIFETWHGMRIHFGKEHGRQQI